MDRNYGEKISLFILLVKMQLYMKHFFLSIVNVSHQSHWVQLL